MDTIDVMINNDGKITVDLGGDLDKACCGCSAGVLHEGLADLGVNLRLNKVNCRLPIAERIRAKIAGTCRWAVANFLHQDPSFESK